MKIMTINDNKLELKYHINAWKITETYPDHKDTLYELILIKGSKSKFDKNLQRMSESVAEQMKDNIIWLVENQYIEELPTKYNVTKTFWI